MYNAQRGLSVPRQRALLPVAGRRGELLRAVERSRGVVVVGATGSGKTTQVPQFLLEAGWCEGERAIVVTEPRRIATVSAAERVAMERGGEVGDEVGYSVRFDHRLSSSTKIIFMTNGTLLRTMMSDPLLHRFSVVLVDEAHERSVECDLLLGLLKKIQHRRGDLRIIVSSATIRAEEFVSFLGPNTTDVVNVEGKSFPVDVAYLQHPTTDYMEEALRVTIDIHRSSKPNSGSILIFLPSGDECEELTASITEKLGRDVLAVPLYASLSVDAQLLALETPPRGRRKIIVATNVAETSVTIDGIAYVVDSLYAKINAYSVEDKATSLALVPISKASADQRAGRAGRTRPGQCFRLCTFADFNQLAPTTPPEIHRVDLTAAILQLKAFGVNDLMAFQFPTPPSPHIVAEALERLFDLGAIDSDGHLTESVGLRMTEIPLIPALARCFIAAEELYCETEMASILGMLQSSTLLIAASAQRERRVYESVRAPYAVAEGDLLTYLNMFNAYVTKGGGKGGSAWCNRKGFNPKGFKQAKRIANNLSKFARPRTDKKKRHVDRLETRLRKAICTGLFLHAAMVSPDGSFSSPLSRTTTGKASCTSPPLKIHPTSVLFDRYPRWIVYVESVYTTEHYMRHVTVIDPQWLVEFAPTRFEDRRKRALEQLREGLENDRHPKITRR